MGAHWLRASICRCIARTKFRTRFRCRNTCVVLCRLENESARHSRIGLGAICRVVDHEGKIEGRRILATKEEVAPIVAFESRPDADLPSDWGHLGSPITRVDHGGFSKATTRRPLRRGDCPHAVSVPEHAPRAARNKLATAQARRPRLESGHRGTNLDQAVAVRASTREEIGVAVVALGAVALARDALPSIDSRDTTCTW